MQERAHYIGEDITEMKFPNAGLRRVAFALRGPLKPIPAYRAVCDYDTDRTFAIVKEGYKLIPHENVIDQLDKLVRSNPEWGPPTREIWLSNYGGRMKTRWTFKEVDFEIRPGDVVHPTVETFCSLDTSLAQKLTVGGYRLVCSNGMTVGRVLGMYKRKHTASLDLDAARMLISKGMSNYSKAELMWKGFANRVARLNEINAFEAVGFNKAEKLSIETSIKKEAHKVTKWDGEEAEDRKVDINAWDLYNILTEEASHRITDITRQAKVLEGIAQSFH